MLQVLQEVAIVLSVYTAFNLLEYFMFSYCHCFLNVDIHAIETIPQSPRPISNPCMLELIKLRSLPIHLNRSQMCAN